MLSLLQISQSRNRRGKRAANGLNSQVEAERVATGLAIMQAIVNGEQDPHELAAYRDGG